MGLYIKKQFEDVGKMLEGIHEIDKMVFEGEMVGTIENEMKRFSKNPDSFIVLYDDERIVGYLTYYTVTPEFAKAVREDYKIHDDDIEPKDIVPFTKGESHYVYLLSVAILPEYQGGSAMKLIGRAFKDEIIERRKNGYEFAEFSSTAISDGGERALGGFGLKYYKTIEQGYKVYLCSGEEFNTK